jgi:hypothetical protein
LSRIAITAAIALFLTGCAASKPATVAKAPPQPAAQVQAPARTPAQPQRARSHAVTDPGEAVWHLRAGLNVAALSCRGRGKASVSGPYSQLLSRHRALLAAAYAGEQRRYGKGLDKHLTKIYNEFAYQPAQGQFCSDAAAVALEANRMDSPTLSSQARRLLGRLG